MLVLDLLNGFILSLSSVSVIFVLNQYLKLEERLKPVFLWVVYCFAIFLLYESISIVFLKSLSSSEGVVFLMAGLCMMMVARQMVVFTKKSKQLKRKKR